MSKISENEVLEHAARLGWVGPDVYAGLSRRVLLAEGRYGDLKNAAQRLLVALDRSSMDVANADLTLVTTEERQAVESASVKLRELLA